MSFIVGSFLIQGSLMCLFSLPPMCDFVLGVFSRLDALMSLFHIHPCVLFPILYFRIFLECLPVASSCILSFVVDFILCLTLSWDLMITLELEGVNLLTVLPTVRERDCILFTILPIVRERRLTCLQFYRLEEKGIPKKKTASGLTLLFQYKKCFSWSFTFLKKNYQLLKFE